MKREIQIPYDGKALMLNRLLCIAFIAAILTIFYGLYFQLMYLVYSNIGFLAVLLASFYFRKTRNFSVSYQIIVIGYLIIVTTSVKSTATYHAAIMFFVATALIPTFFSDNNKAHLFYLLLSVTCAIIYIYYFPIYNFRIEPFKPVVEVITVTGISLLLFYMNQYSRNIIIQKNLLLEQSENKLLKQNQLINDKNEELERYIASNIQLEQYAHIVSHDIKAPLRTILGYNNLIKKNLYDNFSEKEKSYFKTIETGASEMNSLVSDLLKSSKVNSKALNLSCVDLNILVENILTELQFDIIEKNAKIDIDKLPNQIVLDPIKIKQVFLNLLDNSLKYITPNSTPEINIQYEEKNHFHLFSVTDNGVGIKKDYYESIFKPFTSRNPKNSLDSTGLGLSICKTIVEKHGGTIWLQSSPDNGTTFYFKIPKNINIESFNVFTPVQASQQ